MHYMDPTRGDDFWKQRLRTPTILLGRGGSGTRILSELVQGLGVFLGNDINVSGDSVEWVDAIYDLACAETTGLIDETDRENASARLRLCACSVLSAGAYKQGPWGWKLPETVVALPSVLRAFPEPRIIHLVRHPVTSALRRTHMTSRMDNRIGASVLTAAYRAIGRSEMVISTDDKVLHNAITWLYQVRNALRILSSTLAPVLQVSYEDLCDDIISVRLRVASFLSVDPAIEHRPTPIIDRSRTIEPTSGDPRAEEVWELCRATAIELGYNRYGLRR